MDADIQAMDGNHPTVQALDSGDLPTRSFPSVDSRASIVPQCCHPWTLDFGIPSEKTGLQHLCNAESRSLGTSLNLKAINVPLLLEFS